MFLYIIGFSRAGKSTLAQSLAQSWNVPAYDTDRLIELECGQSIAEYVAAKGWDAFRTLESAILLKLGADLSPVSISSPAITAVVACGGGIVELAINREYLKLKRLVWLNPGWQIIYPRLKIQPSALSLDKSESELRQLYAQRYTLYKELIFPWKN